MNSNDGGDVNEYVSPDDVLSERQLERFPGEPEKSNIGSFGDEEWIYEDGTRIYGVEAYGFLSDLIDNDVLKGERGLTDIDVEKLRYVATQVKGVERPVAWVEEDMYWRTGIDEDLPVDGRFYFQGQIPMSTRMRGSEDLARRLSFLRSPSDTDAGEVMDDVEEVDEDAAGMIDWINGRLSTGDLVVPVVYSQSGQPVRSRKAAFVYRPEDQSGLNEDFDRFVKSLAGRKEEALKAELETGSRAAKENEPADMSSRTLSKHPELSQLEDGRYGLAFRALDYGEGDDLEVDISGDELVVLDGEGEEVARRDVEYDRFLDEEDLEGLEVEEVEVSNGVGEAILSEE